MGIINEQIGANPKPANPQHPPSNHNFLQIQIHNNILINCLKIKILPQTSPQPQTQFLTPTEVGLQNGPSTTYMSQFKFETKTFILEPPITNTQMPHIWPRSYPMQTSVNK